MPYALSGKPSLRVGATGQTSVYFLTLNTVLCRPSGWPTDDCLDRQARIDIKACTTRNGPPSVTLQVLDNTGKLTTQEREDACDRLTVVLVFTYDWKFERSLGGAVITSSLRRTDPPLLQVKSAWDCRMLRKSDDELDCFGMKDNKRWEAPSNLEHTHSCRSWNLDESSLESTPKSVTSMAESSAKGNSVVDKGLSASCCSVM
jgi:hypothetical protein